MKPFRSTLLALPALLLPLFTAVPAQAADPWQTLRSVRESLEAGGATTASFVQTYQAQGFETTETETGSIAFDLPDCLRWTYEEPYPKSLLLCGSIVHTWVPGDDAGRRYHVDPGNEPGLDLLLLSTEDLRVRYRAEARQGEEGTAVIHLEPLAGAAGLRSAALTVDEESHRLVALEYVDEEGGRNLYKITGYRPLTEDGTFTPPEGLEWSDD